jgi:dTDP-4-dehydrorhamnose reductase
MTKVFITGGSGALGKVLIKQLKTGSESYDVLSPSSKDCNILDFKNLESILKKYSPNIIIHLAAFVDTFGCENDIKKAIDVNVIGTANLVKLCLDIDCTFVYISSEYVFSGEKGNYTTTDRLDPLNVYGKTKASSEYLVSTLPDYKIIRAPFIRKIYPKVFTDQYCSRYFIDEISAKIIKNIFFNYDNITHIASERMSLYDLYLKKGIKAEPILMSEEQKKTLPKDTSLIDNSI